MLPARHVFKARYENKKYKLDVEFNLVWGTTAVIVNLNIVCQYSITMQME